MQTNKIPTIEELDKIGSEASDLEANMKAARIAATTAIRDAVVAACRPQLRPIAEMPAEVPDGCERLYGVLYDGGGAAVTSFRGLKDTHYIDILLPVPTYPPEFEHAWEQHGKPEPKSAAYALWKGGER